MDKAEAAAKVILQTLIPGAIMRYRNNQSAGEYDFDLEYATGASVPVEVTMSTDEMLEAKIAEIIRSKRGGFVRRQKCQQDWWIHPMRHAPIKKIRTKIETYLVAIEAEGLRSFNSFIDASDSPAVNAIFTDLAIEGGSVTKWKSPAIGIATPGGGGLVNPLLINKAVEREAFKDDNRRKLGSAKKSEKHLFVYLMPTEHVVWVAVRDGELPPSGPTLPPEITHVWLATWIGHGCWHTVWLAQEGLAWAQIASVNLEHMLQS